VERGIEDLVIDDLKKEFGIVGKYAGLRGKIFFNEDIQKVILLNFAARSINRIIILLALDEAENLKDIRRIVGSINWEEYISPEQSFAVKAERVGKHDFTSLDLAREAGATIIETFKESTGKRLKVNLKEPDVIVIAELISNQFLLGIDTTGHSLHMRRYRVYNHPMPLRTTLAYLLVRLSSWNADEILLDPTCGGGTIPIEAALYARQMPIVTFRKREYALYKLRFIDEIITERIKEELLKKVKATLKMRIYGLDINKKHVEGAFANATSAMVADTIDFIHGDARELTKYFKEESVDVIVSNPPYKLSNRKRLRKLYKDIIRNALRILREEGRAVFLTSEIKVMKKELEDLGINFSLRKILRYGSLNTGIFIFRK